MGERGSGTRDKVLDGLRGVAALMVFLIHANGMGLRELGQIGNSIADHGKYGVTVFFVVSAYSLCLSVSPAFDGRPVSWPGYFARRAFRIIPMYFFALAAFAAIGLVEIKSTSSLMATLLLPTSSCPSTRTTSSTSNGRLRLRWRSTCSFRC